ncbi:two-component regulator propeller domain-containing protein [Cystobacter fuscus]|uniref:sensor histidine kinase n=1 Tax=Cystobacter fuscus TaxID=43 RepID=UPI002B2925A1|nr:ATPase [Cystobacter fuscus]
MSRAATFLLRVALMTACLLPRPSVLAAEAPPPEAPSLEHMHHTAWTERDGAPGDAYGIAQTPDGTLWIGSQFGLYRFDGVRFELYTAPDTGRPLADEVYRLYTSRSGELWMGLQLGGIYVLREGVLTRYGQKDGLPSSTVSDFAQDLDGNMWASTSGGLYRFDGQRWQVVEEGGLQRNSNVQTVTVDPRGTVWAATSFQIFTRPRGAAHFAPVSMPRDATGGERNLLGGINVCVDGAGEPWFAIVTGGLMPLADRQRWFDGKSFGSASAGTQGLCLFDRQGGVWIVLEEGLARLPLVSALAGAPRTESFADMQRPGAAVRLSGRSVNALLEDREGNVWVLTNAGVDRFRGNKVVPALPEGPQWSNVALAPAADGGLWIGTSRHGLFLRDASGQIQGPLDGPAPHTSIIVLRRDRAGDLWIGRVGELWRLAGGQPKGQLERMALPVDLSKRGSAVQAIAEDSEGGLWMSFRGLGVHRWKDGQWSAKGGVADLPKDTVVSIEADPAGRVWLGYFNNQLARVEHGHARMLGPSEGLRVGNVAALRPWGERLWVGGNAGVALYAQGRFHALVPASGPDLRGVSGLAQTEEGELWIHGVGGAVRVPREEVEAFASDPTHAVQVERFTADDGLEGSPEPLGPIPTLLRGEDGQLWLPTTTNLFRIDPRRIARNPFAPSVHIGGVTAAGTAYAASEGLRLPALTTAFEIDYTAFSLTQPERVRFRYQLEGVDTGWQEAGNRRRAFYTNVGPGSYRFRVTAANNDGVWNDTGAVFTFTVRPAFHQTTWFYALCALAAAALLWGVYQLRLRQVAAQLRARLEARSQERERIARELHDTLLQGTQGLILSIQGLAAELPESHPTRGRIEAVLDRADQVVEEARDRVRDLRAEYTAARDLPRAFALLGEELASERSTRFGVLVKGTPRDMPGAVRDEAYRIGREALLNAFAHARAQAVEVEFVYEPGAFLLRVRDDGTGIDEEVLAQGSRPGHWGLVGMHERAQRLGGQLELWSRPGAGTEVQLRLPAVIAYASVARHKPRWWRFDRPPPAR